MESTEKSERVKGGHVHPSHVGIRADVRQSFLQLVRRRVGERHSHNLRFAWSPIFRV